MNNNIIKIFIHNKSNTFNFMLSFIKKNDDTMDKITLNKDIKFLIRKKILKQNNKYYDLTDEGLAIMNNNKYYYSRIICDFIFKYSIVHKKYELKRSRDNQQKLRKYLIDNKNNICVICNKKLPLCLLETAHIKPYCILKKTEILDNNIVEFMCRYCHKLYDSGYIGIDKGNLKISSSLINGLYDLTYKHNVKIKSYNCDNKTYFDFHQKYIFKS